MEKQAFVAAVMFMSVMAACSVVGFCLKEEAKDKVNVAIDWASDKFSGGLGIEQDTAQDLMNKAGDAASRATETINSAASETSEYVSEKAGDMGSSTSENVNEGINRASDTANKAKESLQDMAGYGKDEKAENVDSSTMVGNWKTSETEEAYEEALKRVGQSYGAAKETMSEGAKSAYEAAKEKASEATGHLGSAIGKGIEL